MNKRFECCISLGWFCGTASSMGKCGLRSHSGPFDWYFSDLEPVLKTIETEFCDFMKRENLVVDHADQSVFIDTKYGFHCNHDITYDFDTEYPSIYQKYMRRAERFLRDTKYPTCFIRAVRSEEELQFIEGNEEYILKTIRKRNPENEIIFLLLKDMKSLPCNCIFQWFRLGIASYAGYPYDMRMMFESSKKFLGFCSKKILSEEAIACNKRFDRGRLDMGEKIGFLIERLGRGIGGIELVLKEYWKTIDCGIYLWGAGKYGKVVLRFMLDKGIKIKGVIDSDSGKIGTLCYGIQVGHFDNEIKNDAFILITIGSPVSENEVKRQLAGKISDSHILGLTDLVMHPVILDLI